eukprot:TRINITY_DN26795_c0_g1_i1.p1 TRINITY_DN26795_c0_g1~~TRINITY_DN26795_c0_g1_i1.p1  ORF type:complete len:180 (+),score=16.78 TRINITY_DN26795_c0_g1_i1:65-604(+)
MEPSNHKSNRKPITFPPEKVGRELLMKVIDDNTRQLLTVLRNIMTQHQGEDQAKLYHDWIIKAAIKVAWLYKKKLLVKEDLNALRVSFRRVCSSIINTFRLLDVQPMDVDRMARISRIIKNFKMNVMEQIGGYISVKSTSKVETVFDYLASSDFLFVCFSDVNVFKDVVYVLNYYLDVS